MGTLWAALEGLPDHRTRKGRRYSLASIVTLSLSATLAVHPESGEMVEALRLIRDLPIGPGDVVTGDAAFTYRPLVDAIRDKGADYFLFVKGNQPDLQAEIAAKFGELSPLGEPPPAGVLDAPGR